MQHVDHKTWYKVQPRRSAGNPEEGILLISGKAWESHIDKTISFPPKDKNKTKFENSTAGLEKLLSLVHELPV